MIEPILSREEIRRRARAAFAAGLTAKACTFNPHSEAFREWMQEYRRLSNRSNMHEAVA